MIKFEERMQGVLPLEELPSFFAVLTEMGQRPRKSLRIRRDLEPAALQKWTQAKFREIGIPLEEVIRWYPEGFYFDLKKFDPHPSRHPAIAAGLVFIQEAGAMEVVPALEVEPYHLVLDLCAAPGAKSTHIGEYLGPEGILVANEPHRDRAKLLDVILARHGIGNSTIYNLEPHQLAKTFPDLFDRILVDAPCSGESLFAKRNEKRKDVSHKEVERCALRQSAILENGARMLAPGGRIVYATCAYSRVENEDVVETFLESHSEFHLVREQRRFPHRDFVPGGYFAVLERAGESPHRMERLEKLRSGVRAIGSSGLVRDGVLRWDGHPDSYARALDRKRSAPVSGEVLENLDFGGAVALLVGADKFTGEVPPGETIVYTWEGERLASATGETLHYPRGRLN
jgi:16S rRNA C967 or C1407 C5-methylase (RsmB/RsmF family)